MDTDIEYINKNDALKRVGGKEDLYIKLLKQFLESNTAQSLNTHINENNIEKAAMDAHSVKGVGANLSLPKLADISAQLEKKLKNGEDYNDKLKEFNDIYNTTVQQIEIVIGR